jgi:hypothetical protein
MKCTLNMLLLLLGITLAADGCVWLASTSIPCTQILQALRTAVLPTSPTLGLHNHAHCYAWPMACFASSCMNT